MARVTRKRSSKSLHELLRPWVQSRLVAMLHETAPEALIFDIRADPATGIDACSKEANVIWARIRREYGDDLAIDTIQELLDLTRGFRQTLPDSDDESLIGLLAA